MENDLMTREDRERCRLCGGTSHRLVGAAPGYQENRTYTICECESCLASFAFPLEADDALYGHIYRNIRSVPGYNRYYRYAYEVLAWQRPLAYLIRQEESYWAVARHLRTRRAAGTAPSVLEIGCGMGYFTHALAEDGFSVTGVDISSQAIAWARDHYGNRYETATLGDLKARRTKYDAIIMNQLVEHLPDINGFIAEALELLSRDGELIITTPNKSAFPDADWETDLPPVHLWWLGEDAMKHLAKQHACELVFMDFSTFYDSCVRPRLQATPVASRKPVLDAQGSVLHGQELPPLGGFRRVLERTGALDILRRTRAEMSGCVRWHGARGPIIAAVLRRLR
ncbi:MAG: hypothetical protein A2X58_05815 [Nitrospirae bacterium GWC2_56_14]|nr:MAG: hypothetical protein A2X58_05815 [Nitrospirae bacterium GWC2_56_14]